jgi:AcrR family transcriptional regulator
MQRKDKELQLRHQIIIDAASELFAAKGYHNTTMDDVAEKAELAKATLYKLCPAKENLYMDVLKNIFEQFNTIAESSMQGRSSLKDKLTGYVKNLITHFIAKADFFRLLIKEMNEVQLPETGSKQLMEVHGKLNSILIEELKAGIKRKEIRNVDPVKTACIFNHMVFGSHLNNFYGLNDGKKIDETVTFLIDLLFQGIEYKGR